ncbi:hypothetical protein [Nocardia sp. NPDC052112]|uniref:hypothetical protein n=1 Tax=Nocardia sp. NPDC052112 TaxID=3155646 RepID=UPI00342C2852
MGHLDWVPFVKNSIGPDQLVGDPATGRAPLCCRRAAAVFEAHTGHYDDSPYTLHQLPRSRLTHAAEEGASTPVLMKLSGHTSVRSLAKYARVSDKGCSDLQLLYPRRLEFPASRGRSASLRTRRQQLIRCRHRRPTTR